jgi:hypothetical protein
VAKTRRHRLETLFDFVLARGGNPREGATMEGIGGGENFEPSLIVAEFSGELVKALIGLGSAIAEKHLARTDGADQFGGQATLRLGEIEIGDVNDFF